MKTIKKKKLTIILLLIIAAALVVLCNCNNRETTGSNIMAADLLFEMPKKAEERFTALVTNTNLNTVFKRDQINIFFPQGKWRGRVRDRGVSLQALFAVDNSRILYKAGSLKQKKLDFSIYNPAGSKLFYRIFITNKKRKIKLYSGYFDKLQFYRGSVQIEDSFEEGVDILFETGGKGVGAWVNPRFTRVKQAPRVFVVIVLDTLRRDSTSLYGYKRKTTPVMEKLASEGVVFNNAFSTTSWTLPAHVSLFSGKDLVGHKVTAPEDKILTDYPLLAEVFQKNGFVTAAFTGGGFVSDHYGFHRGFQVYSNLPGRVFMLNSAEMVLQHFKNYVETYWGEDLFVFLHTYQVHAPYKFTPKYVRHFNKNLNVNLQGPANFIRDRKTGYYQSIAEEKRQLLIDLYDTSIFYADKYLVGGVVQYLKDKGVYREAMVVVTGDHGEEFYEHGSWEHGHSVYNELIRIPLLVKYPGSRKKGVENALVSIADIPGIILKESGLKYDRQAFAARFGDEKRVLPVLFPHSPIIKDVPARISFVDKDYHFIHNIFDPEKLKVFNPPPRVMEVFELYARTDSAEKNNLARKRSGEMKEFRRLSKKYMLLLRSLKSKKGKLDASLEKELKSLGYLKD